ncbi:hypothetical protein JCM8547_004833 [Rhodosporidiobolus lusitaniae]
METTIADLPAMVSTLSSTLLSLPSSLTSANLTLLAYLLDTLTSDLSPALPSLSEAQQSTLLSNTTFLSQSLSSLSSLTSQLPSADIASASPADLVALLQIGATRYTIMTAWAPEVWVLVGAYGVAAVFKAAMVVMVGRRKVLERVMETVGREREKEGLMGGTGGIGREEAEARVKRPAKAALGHLLNLVASTLALVFQLLAYRLFILPSSPIRLSDVKYLSIAMKVVLTGYVCDLLFGDLRPEIFLHHFFTFALLFVGQLAAFETKSPKFFRLADWLLLQATTEQTTYAAMACYHLYTYLTVQSHRSRLSHSLLVLSSRLLNFTRLITFPQKILPAAFALYWLARMWHNIDDSAWGRTWIVWSTMLLSALLLLQVKFSDDVFPLAGYVNYKLHGSGALPPRQGPVMRFLLRPFSRRHSHSRVRTSEEGEENVELSGTARAGLEAEKVELAKLEGEGNEGRAALAVARTESAGASASTLARYDTPDTDELSLRQFRPLSLVNSAEGGGLEMGELLDGRREEGGGGNVGK